MTVARIVASLHCRQLGLDRTDIIQNNRATDRETDIAVAMCSRFPQGTTTRQIRTLTTQLEAPEIRLTRFVDKTIAYNVQFVSSKNTKEATVILNNLHVL